MAVIIDMDMPKDCYECILRYQAFCFDGHHEPHLDKSRCPLKSVDDMVAEIEKLDTMGVSYQPFINKHDVIDIIHKYTKEQTETWRGFHGDITAPKGTFEKIFNDCDTEGDGI